MSEIYENRQYVELVEQNEINHQLEERQYRKNKCLSCCIYFISIIIAILIAIIVLVLLYGPTVYQGYVAFKAAEDIYVNVKSEHPDYVAVAQDLLPFVFR